MRKKGNVINAPNTQTIIENGKLDPVSYRPNAPAGARRRATDDFRAYDHFGVTPPGGRLLRDERKPWQKKGGNPDEGRTLHKLPCSIADGAVD
jgi:hypothetical protein